MEAEQSNVHTQDFCAVVYTRYILPHSAAAFYARDVFLKTSFETYEGDSVNMSQMEVEQL
jgi:hypothetical protein